MLKFRVRLDDCVGTHHQLLGKGPNSRQGIAGFEHADFNGMTHLLDDLSVNGLPRRLAYCENHSGKSVSLL